LLWPIGFSFLDVYFCTACIGFGTFICRHAAPWRSVRGGLLTGVESS
jgi:hypothetical protein